MNKVIWVYAVTAPLDPDQLSGLIGVAGEPVRAVGEAGLSAVVGSVDATVFGEDSLSSLLADVTSIETIGRAHHQVVASVADGGPVVPLRIATTYPDDTTVRGLLAEHHTELAELLASLGGTQEWGVKVYLRPPDTPEPCWREAEERAEEIDRALSDIAVAAHRHPSPYLRFDDGDGWMVLNGIYLVDAGQGGAFTGITRQLRAEHAALQLQVTGPWPPYSFVDRQEV